MGIMPTRPLSKLNFPTRKQKTVGWNVRDTAMNPTLTRTPSQLSQREAETRSSATVTFIGGVAFDFFSREK